MKPAKRPARPFFSSGPCAKHPGWSTAALADACTSRSHRSKPGKSRIQDALNKSRELLGLPDDYLIGIVPASDTGAVEMALWSLLGARGVDLLAWESFSAGWVSDVIKQLKLEDTRTLEAPYGQLPDLSEVDCSRDVVFVWNGTTSGVRVPDANWIDDNREGLTICDATSAAFAQPLPWEKLDVVTYSWQKVLGGEAAHGMLILSPRAVARLESWTPPWPMPKIFRLSKGGKLIKGIFEGATINTPSMLCVEDYLDALRWAESIGGLSGLHGRADANLAAITEWVEATDWIDFLPEVVEQRSNTSVCLKVVEPGFAALDEGEQRSLLKQMTGLLDGEGVAFDIDAYRDAPPGLRIWAGATVDTADLRDLLPWLEWAWSESFANA